MADSFANNLLKFWAAWFAQYSQYQYSKVYWEIILSKVIFSGEKKKNCAIFSNFLWVLFEGWFCFSKNWQKSKNTLQCDNIFCIFHESNTLKSKFGKIFLQMAKKLAKNHLLCTKRCRRLQVLKVSRKLARMRFFGIDWTQYGYTITNNYRIVSKLIGILLFCHSLLKD